MCMYMCIYINKQTNNGLAAQGMNLDIHNSTTDVSSCSVWSSIATHARLLLAMSRDNLIIIVSNQTNDKWSYVSLSLPLSLIIYMNIYKYYIYIYVYICVDIYTYIYIYT